MGKTSLKCYILYCYSCALKPNEYELKISIFYQFFSIMVVCDFVHSPTVLHITELLIINIIITLYKGNVIKSEKLNLSTCKFPIFL